MSKPRSSAVPYAALLAGVALAASAVLESIRVGGLTFRNQSALVLRQGHISLLGVTVLRRFRSFEISGDRLTLRW